MTDYIEVTKGSIAWRVDELRPEWLGDDDLCLPRGEGDSHYWGEWYSAGDITVWDMLDTLRIPRTHWAAPAIEGGWRPWAGGDRAPDDWDGGNVLYRNGSTGGALDFVGRWLHPHTCSSKDPDFDIIGYKPKPTARVSPELDARAWALGTRVTKTKGSSWSGKIVGFYSTTLTPEGYCVESDNEPGSVQIYPRSALAELEPPVDPLVATLAAAFNCTPAEAQAALDKHGLTISKEG